MSERVITVADVCAVIEEARPLFREVGRMFARIDALQEGELTEDARQALITGKVLLAAEEARERHPEIAFPRIGDLGPELVIPLPLMGRWQLLAKLDRLIREQIRKERKS